MRYSPSPKNKKYEVASITLIIAAVAMFFFAAQSYVKGKAAVQFLGVATLAAAAYFLIRRITVYTYIIMPQKQDKAYTEALAPSELSFTVAKRRAPSGDIYLCQMDLGSLKSVTLLPENRRERKQTIEKNGKMAIYKYLATFGESGAYLLVFDKVGYSKTGIIAELDEEMAGYLETVVQLNKADGDE